MTDQECAVSTEEVLTEIADAVASKPKKERKAKHDPEGGVMPEKKERKARAKKEPEYQKDENGELILGEDGQPLPVVKAKKVREPKLDANGNPISRTAGKAVTLLHGDKEVSVKEVQNTATITVTRDLGSRDGSKRAERAKAFQGAEFVNDFLANGGALRDLYRHLRSGAVELHIEGEKLSVKE